jgi:mannose-6-phosphate isomerase-like protein (cupin superfamily)
METQKYTEEQNKRKQTTSNVPDENPKRDVAVSGAKIGIPADDPNRTLSLIDPDDPSLSHIAVVGDTYTILLSGKETAGRYCLIDMQIPICGGPGAHRHDFEEMFHVLEGTIEFTFRGEKRVAHAGQTINIPANAPHFFTNNSGNKSRLLCMCTPAGQEEFFMATGDRVENRTTSAPELSPEEKATFMKKAEAAAPKYKTEILKP